MKSICKTARILDVVFKIFRIVVIVACVTSLIAAAFVGAALLFNIELDLIGEENRFLELGGVQITFHDGFQVALNDVLWISFSGIAMLLVTAFASLISIRYIRAILKPMTEGEPFRNIVAENLKKLAWLQIIYGAIRFFLDGVQTFLVNHFCGDALDTAIASSGIKEISYEVESDMSFLIIAAALFLLSYIFRYAQELQKLSDETL